MIYIGPDVGQVRELLVPTLIEIERTYSIRERLQALAATVKVGHEDRHPGALVLARNHRPDLAGPDDAAFFDRELSDDEAWTMVARDHGWSDGSDVPEDPSLRLDPDFEIAVHAVISGDDGALRECLGATPDLVRDRSTLGHGATLFHYLTANAVEIHRQVVPMNAVRIAELLLTSGADPRATMRAYGGEYGPLALLETSGHPQAAGVAQGLAAVLRSWGGA